MSIKHASDALKCVTRSHALRSFHVRSLAVPVFAWAGVFARVDRKVLLRLRDAAASAIRGWLPRGYSKFLVWDNTLRPDDDICFTLNFAALRILKWHCRRSFGWAQWERSLEPAFLQSNPMEWAPELRYALKAFDFTFDITTNVHTRIDTAGYMRFLRLAWDSTTVLEKWASEAWRAALFAKEARVFGSWTRPVADDCARG